jgi:hypothetical protein
MKPTGKEHGGLVGSGVAYPGGYRRFAAKSLLHSAVAFAIALVAGAGASDAAHKLVWGALWLGALWTALTLVMLAVLLLFRRRLSQPGSHAGEKSGATRVVEARAFDTDSWVGRAVFVAAIVVLAIVDPLLAAFFAGILLGVAIIPIPAMALIDVVIDCWKGRRSKRSGGL